MKLNQFLAIKKGVVTRTKAVIDTLHKASQKPALFKGQIKK